MNVLTHQPLLQGFYFLFLLFLLPASEIPYSVTSTVQLGLRQRDGTLQSDSQVFQDVFLQVSLETRAYPLIVNAEKVK